MDEMIKVSHLTKDYQGGKGIFDFDFCVSRGEVVGLVGTNGSGKTTTMRHLMGFVRGNQGSASVAGLDAWKDTAYIKKLVGYVPGQIDFPDVGTGAEFLKIQAELAGIKDYTSMNELIDRFKIDVSAPLKRMSKGMKQKMGLVVAFMGEPDIYILDEPSTGLDPLMRDALIELILEQKAKGKTVLISSHIFKELEAICDRVIFIKDGHIVSEVDRSQYESDPMERYSIKFASKKEFQRYLDSRDLIKGCQGKLDDQFEELAKFNRIELDVSQKHVNELFRDLSGYNLAAIDNVSFTLEKYYIEIIENQERKR